jgi:hypothetical protein
MVQDIHALTVPDVTLFDNRESQTEKTLFSARALE